MTPKSALRLLALAGALTLASSAQAFDFGLRLEAGPAFPVSNPQNQLFLPGGSLALRLDLGIVSWLSFQVGGTFIGLPSDLAANSNSALGVAWLVGGGLRLKRPFDADGGTMFPWVEFNANYARTGTSNNFAFDVGAGLYINGDEERHFFIGPFLRYVQIVDPSSPGRDSTDAKMILFGISAEFGSAHARPAPPPAPAPPPDRDNDGVADADDKCPDIAGPKENFGCPVEVDTDKDTVLDKDDACPTVPGKPELKGCPDKDNDGIADADDACPDEAGPVATQGCPDKDGDGVADKDDKCPDVAGPKENNGCPPDKDGDGVPDADDNCPDVAGTVANHGCPEYKAVKVTAEKLEIAQKIYFANNQSKILPKSFGLLNEVAKVLADNAKFRVRVEGHTDNKGKPARNKTLSADRAGAVKAYLVNKGVAADRLESAGFGSDKPIADNKNEAGREQNRRVEFVIIPPAAPPADATPAPAPAPADGAAKP